MKWGSKMDGQNLKDEAFRSWAYCFTTFDMILNSELSASVGDSVYPLIHNTMWKMKWLMAHYEDEIIEEEIGSA